MPEKKRTPHQSREEMRGVSQSKWHLHDKSAEELLTELEAKLDSMTDQTYDEELVDAYLEALDEKAPLPEQFDVESSWNQFRSKHSILFDADDILPNPKHSRSFSHKFRFRKAIPQLVAAAAIVGVLGMFGAQAAGIDVFGALGRWTEETFHFVAPKASAAPTYHTVSNGDGFYELEQYSTLQDAFDAYSISDPLAPSWIPEGYTLDYVEVSPSDTEIIFSASYSKEQNTLSFLYSYRKDGTFTSSTFEKDGSSVVEYIQNGITHYIMSNLSVQLSAWVNGNCECSITGPISEKEMIAIIVLAFCTGFVIHASAVERASLYLTRYSATVSASNNGAIEMSIFVVANKSVSELGASYILLEESDDGGKTWSTAREYEGQSWMTAENRSTYSRTLSYPGTIGHQYRVTAEVFAKDANGGDSRTTPTSPVVTAKR